MHSTPQQRQRSVQMQKLSAGKRSIMACPSMGGIPLRDLPHSGLMFGRSITFPPLFGFRR